MQAYLSSGMGNSKVLCRCCLYCSDLLSFSRVYHRYLEKFGLFQLKQLTDLRFIFFYLFLLVSSILSVCWTVVIKKENGREKTILGNQISLNWTLIQEITWYTWTVHTCTCTCTITKGYRENCAYSSFMLSVKLLTCCSPRYCIKRDSCRSQSLFHL